MIKLLLQRIIFQFSSIPVNTHQYGDDSSVSLLHQVADDLVVEELNRLPLRKKKR